MTGLSIRREREDMFRPYVLQKSQQAADGL
jgi:hypothetical protein